MLLTKIKEKIRNIPIQQKASTAYIFGSLVSKSMSILTLPLFLRFLSTEDMGVNSVYSSWYIVFHSIMTLALTSGSVNVAMKDFPEDRNNYLSSTLTLTSIISVVFFVFVFCFVRPLSTLTTLNPILVLFMAGSIVINPALELWYVKQRYEYKYVASLIVSLSVSILTTVGALLCVYIFRNIENIDLGEVKVLSGGIITTSISAAFYILIMISGKKHFDIKLWKYALFISLPLVIHLLGKNVLDISDKLMISYISGKSDAGIYGTVYSLASIPHIFWIAINTAIIPAIFEDLKKDDLKSVDKSSVRIIILFGLIAIFFSLLAPEILLIFTSKDYYDGISIIPAVIAGVFFTVIYGIYGNFLLYKKKTVLIMVGTVLAAIINVVLNMIFISRFGYIAAAYTTLVSFMLLACFQGIMVQIVYKASVVSPFNIIIISTLVTAICLLSNLVYNYSILRYLLMVIVLFSIVLFFFKRVRRIRK